MGGADGFKQNLGRVRVVRGSQNWGMARNISLFSPRISDAQNTSIGFSEWTVVHELAHAWDFAHGTRLSLGLKNYVGAHRVLRKQTTEHGGEYRYDPGVWPPPAGIDLAFNRFEDFAESVAAFVYPELAQQLASARHLSYSMYNYRNYYETPRAEYVAGLLGKEVERQALAWIYR
jgi:hypothetical protein